MSNGQKQSWRMNKRDVIFLGIIAAVILVLVLGNSKRTTKVVPNDATHLMVTKLSQCMACHNATSARPTPVGHVKGGQCFQCHSQPKDWKGASR